MSVRRYDVNGWFEAPDNPLSLVGIFQYLGSSIGALEPDRVYNVLRPVEELSDPEALASFRLLPWIDEHTMLGEDFDADAEERGVAGVIGENVWFDPTLGEFGGMRGNVKCFSEAQAKRLSAGKDELSAGYRCVYDFTPGTFNGKPYDVVQRTLRGNHVASVMAGRMGSIVAVLDHMTFTTDGMEFHPVKKKLTAADLERANKSPALAAFMAAMDAEEADKPADGEDEGEKDGKDADADKKAEDEIPDELKKGEDEDADADKKAEDEIPDELKKGEDEDADKKAEDEDDKAKGSGMDEATIIGRIASRDRLAKNLRPVIGAFDHSGMTLEATAAYGVKKLGLRGVPAGQEQTAIAAYLAGAAKASAAQATGLDSKDATKRSGFVSRRLGK